MVRGFDGSASCGVLDCLFDFADEGRDFRSHFVFVGQVVLNHLYEPASDYHAVGTGRSYGLGVPGLADSKSHADGDGGKVLEPVYEGLDRFGKLFSAAGNT